MASLTSVEALEIAARVRRLMPRNMDVMALCEFVDRVAREATAPVGRPRIENREKTIEAQKPWLKAGMSRATWYRRQKERRAEGKA